MRQTNDPNGECFTNLYNCHCCRVRASSPLAGRGSSSLKNSHNDGSSKETIFIRSITFAKAADDPDDYFEGLHAYIFPHQSVHSLDTSI